MLTPGVVLIVGASSVEGLFGRASSGSWSWIPGDVLVRTGSCLIILGILAHASRYIVQLPRVFGALAQESLVVYFVHLCVVYGSIWNRGPVRLLRRGADAGSPRS